MADAKTEPYDLDRGLVDNARRAVQQAGEALRKAQKAIHHARIMWGALPDELENRDRLPSNFQSLIARLRVYDDPDGPVGTISASGLGVAASTLEEVR